MDKELAIYITSLIVNDIEKRFNKDMSNGICITIENLLKRNKYIELEEFLNNICKDTRTVSQIVKECENINE